MIGLLRPSSVPPRPSGGPATRSTRSPSWARSPGHPELPSSRLHLHPSRRHNPSPATRHRRRSRLHLPAAAPIARRAPGGRGGHRCPRHSRRRVCRRQGLHGTHRPAERAAIRSAGRLVERAPSRPAGRVPRRHPCAELEFKSPRPILGARPRRQARPQPGDLRPAAPAEAVGDARRAEPQQHRGIPGHRDSGARASCSPSW